MKQFNDFIFSTFISLVTINIASPVLAASEQAKTTSLEQCYDTIGSKPRTELAPCLTKKLADANKGMSDQLSKTRKEITDTGSSAVKAALKSLASSQKNFLVFRESECQRVGDAALGGSGANDFQRGCLVDLTIWRIKQLSE